MRNSSPSMKKNNNGKVFYGQIVVRTNDTDSILREDFSKLDISQVEVLVLTMRYSHTLQKFFKFVRNYHVWENSQFDFRFTLYKEEIERHYTDLLSWRKESAPEKELNVRQKLFYLYRYGYLPQREREMNYKENLVSNIRVRISRKKDISRVLYADIPSMLKRREDKISDTMIQSYRTYVNSDSKINFCKNDQKRYLDYRMTCSNGNTYFVNLSMVQTDGEFRNKLFIHNSADFVKLTDLLDDKKYNQLSVATQLVRNIFRI